MKRLLTLLLLGTILFQPLWAEEASPLSGKAVHPLSLFKKKRTAVKSRPLPGLIGYSEISPAVRPGGPDSVELGRFLQETCGTGRTRELSGTDKLWGTLGTVASGACAGVAAVQWLDPQNSKGQKANGGKDPGPNPSAKAI